MNRKLSFHQNLNKRAHVLLIVLIYIIFVLNIFTFTVLIYFNEKTIANDKLNYYHLFLLEERAKTHIFDKITSGNVTHFETEMLYFDDDFIYLRYFYNFQNRYYHIEMRIYHNGINQYADLYFYIDTQTLIYTNR